MIEVITNILVQAINEPEVKVTIPEDPKFGHYSTNLAMVYARSLEITPQEAAKEIREKVLQAAPRGFFERIEIAGQGFLNFYLSKEAIAKEVSAVFKKKDKYGSSDRGKGKTVVVDYSAPNIAKPMSVGHFRATIIGAAIVNLLKFQGYKVISDNHLGDWGTQFGALLYAYKHWLNEEEFKKSPIDHLVALYVRFHEESRENEAMMTAAREETSKLQKGDKENTKLWKLFIKASFKEFGRIYKRLGVKFDAVLGESFYQPMLSGIVSDAMKAGIARKDEGAVKIFFEGTELSPAVIEKSDGSHLYATTDLATVKYRMAKWKPVKILYVVGNEQSLHLAQIFKAVELMSYAPGTELTHVKFGMVLGASGKKFSTRRGDFIKVEELLDKAKEAAAEVNPVSAEVVGVGAVKYYDLSHYRTSDIVFDWDAMLNLKGNSAPYLQYTYSRLMSVARKAKGIKPNFDADILSTNAEKRVMESLIHFPDAAAYAADKYEPNHLADYLFRLANVMNAFYETCPVIKADKRLASARLALAIAGATAIKNGLTVLGISVPEKM